MKQLEFDANEIKNLVIKDDEGFSSYILVSIEEMDWVVEQSIKYQKLHNQWFESIENKDDTIFFLRKCKEVFEDFKPDVRKAMT